MGSGPENSLTPERRAEIEAAAEATAHVVHRFLKEVNQSVEKLHRDLHGISQGAGSWGNGTAPPARIGMWSVRKQVHHPFNSPYFSFIVIHSCGEIFHPSK